MDVERRKDRLARCSIIRLKQGIGKKLPTVARAAK
jgi:hypothetical protein